jgi:hypothetical protein
LVTMKRVCSQKIAPGLKSNKKGGGWTKTLPPQRGVTKLSYLSLVKFRRKLQYGLCRRT